MSKRIAGLLLLVAMLMTMVLTSCSSLDEDYEEDTSTVKPITLTLYGIMEEGTTPEAVEAVEAAINKYTQKNYKTTIDLNFFYENEVVDENGNVVSMSYDDAIEDVYAKLEAQRLRDEQAEDAANAAAKLAREEAKKLSEDDRKEKKEAQRAYEDWAEENVVEDETNIEMEDDVVLDIFLMRGFDDYQEAAENELLADLSSYANGTYKLIHKYASSIVLQSAKMNGMLYAIPSNKLLETADNEAYYYAVKTDLLEKYNLSIEEGTIPNLDTTFSTFFAQVKENEDCEVILAPPTAIQNFDFYLDDMNSYPIYGARSNESYATNSSTIEFTYKVLDPNDLAAGAANSHYKKMSNYRVAGYFAPEGSTVENTDFALGVFRGTLDGVKAQLGDKADEYSYYIYKSARITNDIVFENMLAVSADCKYPDRAFQVIAGLYTVEELRNLITFGIKDVNYTVNEDGETIKMLNNEYNIDFERYGNSLIGYTPEELGANYQADSAKKNSQVKVSAYLGYIPALEEADIDALTKVCAVAGEYQQALMNGVEDVEALYSEAMLAMGKEENVLGVYPEEDQDEEDFTPSYTLVMQALSSDYSTYAGSGRPQDKQVPNNEFLSKEESDKLDAIEREKESIIISAKEVLEDGLKIFNRDKTYYIEKLESEEGESSVVATEVIRVTYDKAFDGFIVTESGKDISKTANVIYVLNKTRDTKYVVENGLEGFILLTGVDEDGNEYITPELEDVDESKRKYTTKFRMGDIINSNYEVVRNILDDALAAGEVFEGEVSINLEDIGIVAAQPEEAAQ